MVETVARWSSSSKAAAFVLIAGLVMTVAGCANTGRASEAGLGPEVITPSDEPEARRRARIRLELAVNYFETGKVAVALDEVKQALVNDPTYGGDRKSVV